MPRAVKKKVAADLHAFKEVHSVASPSMKRDFGKYVPRVRDEHEALPPQLSVWDRPTYNGSELRMQPSRPGATNALQIKSRGV
jgi:hypothetical protein